MTSKFASKQFWIDTVDRAVATFAQAAVASLTADAVGVLNVDWPQVGSIAGLASVVSILTSIAFRGRESDPAPTTGFTDDSTGFRDNKHGL